MCIVQSHDIKCFFCNQELNRWWLRNIRSYCQFNFIWPSSFVWYGCVEGERGPWWMCSTCFIMSSTLVPPILRSFMSCHVCPYSAWLWYEPIMFYILLFLSFFVVFGNNGYFCLILFVQFFCWKHHISFVLLIVLKYFVEMINLL
jgi:hypothetical protein